MGSHKGSPYASLILILFSHCTFLHFHIIELSNRRIIELSNRRIIELSNRRIIELSNRRIIELSN